MQTKTGTKTDTTVETGDKPGLFQRLWQKLDNSMKKKAETSSSCCCEDEDSADKGSKSKCC